MTVQSFIVLYNETFRYLRDKFGPEAVYELWSALSSEWCCHLNELVAEHGLSGMQLYWGGDSGTLAREKADFETRLTDDAFSLEMFECPSIAEIVNTGRIPMEREPSYCEHCLALYGPVAEKHGYKMDYTIDYLADGACSGRCRFIVRPAERP